MVHAISRDGRMRRAMRIRFCTFMLFNESSMSMRPNVRLEMCRDAYLRLHYTVHTEFKLFMIVLTEVRSKQKCPSCSSPASDDAWQFANTGVTSAIGIMAFGE